MTHRPPGAADEQARLNDFLADVDPSLLASLRRDEKRRRKKLFLFTITGGLVMGSAIALLAVLLLAPPAPSEQAKKADQALALANEGWQLLNKQEPAQAVEKFKQATTLHSDNANAWNGLGWAHVHAGDLDAAEPAFARALEIQKDHPAALNGIGLVAFNRKDYPAAEKRWLTAADRAPAASFNLAKLYLLESKWDDATRYAEKAAASAAASRTPDAATADASAQKLLAAARAKKLDPVLKAMIEPRPAKPDVSRAWALLNQGKPNQAREFFEAAVKADPKNQAALNGLGFTLINLGKPAEAKPHFEAILKADPKAAGPLNGLALCLKAEGKVDEAVATWKKMAALYPGPTAAAAGLATTYFERKDYANALPYLEQLTQAAPDNPHYQQMLDQARNAAK